MGSLIMTFTGSTSLLVLPLFLVPGNVIPGDSWWSQTFQPSQKFGERHNGNLKYYNQYDDDYEYDDYYGTKRRGHKQAEDRNSMESRQKLAGPLVVLAPLVGLTALYGIAFLNTNPTLLTLANLRKKRSLSNFMEDENAGLLKGENAELLQEIGTLSNFVSSTPGLELDDRRDLLMAQLLEYQPAITGCLEMLVCEYSRESGDLFRKEE